MKVPLISLSDNHQIPQIGLGTWKNTDPNQYQTAFQTAIEAGYRHFDTAQAYRNEQLLGENWVRAGLKREELFITTKIDVRNFGFKRSKKSFQESLQKLQTDYVDLLLLHFPVPLTRQKTWRALEEIHSSGGAKSIGVSNYTVRHVQQMKKYATTLPVVNQVEMHVFLQQPELVKYCQDHNIRVEAYSPLARANILDNPTVTRIAKKRSKTYAQIMLRFLLQQKLVIIPKSVTPLRIKENIDILDFELDEADLTDLKQEDQNKRFCWSPVHIP